jgi:hypothetical protein
MSKPYAKDAFWYSRLQDARSCLRLYKLKHLDGVRLTEENLDMVFGTGLHLGLNEILSGEGDGIELFEMFFDTYRGRDLPGFSFSWEELRAMGPVFLSRFERLHAKHFRPFKMEERMYGQIGPHKFEGTADFLGWYKDVPSVLDFKTSSKAYHKKKVISDEQMPGYAHLSATTLGFKPEQAVFFVFVKDRSGPKIQTPQIVQLTDAVLSSTIQNMREQMDDLTERKVFPKNPGHCVRGNIICPAFHLCHPEVEKE